MALQQIERLQDDPRIRYELVDGDWYPYTGPAGDVNKPVPCEEVDGILYPFAEAGAPVVQGYLHRTTVLDFRNQVTALLIDWPNVGVFSDTYLFWEEGQRKLYAPDVCVFPTITQGRWQSIYQWKHPYCRYVSM